MAYGIREFFLSRSRLALIDRAPCERRAAEPHERDRKRPKPRPAGVAALADDALDLVLVGDNSARSDGVDHARQITKSRGARQGFCALDEALGAECSGAV